MRSKGFTVLGSRFPVVQKRKEKKKVHIFHLALSIHTLVYDTYRNTGQTSLQMTQDKIKLCVSYISNILVDTNDCTLSTAKLNGIAARKLLLCDHLDTNFCSTLSRQVVFKWELSIA